MVRGGGGGRVRDKLNKAWDCRMCRREGRLVIEGTWTFQVAPEAGWARRKGPVTLRARLMPTAARRLALRTAAAAHACSLSAPVHLRPNSVNKNYDA